MHRNSRPSTARPRRVLITGGLGFVGFHLATALLEQDPTLRLTIVDNLSSTRLPYASLEHRATIHIADLRDFEPATEGYDDVFHLASPVGSLAILERHGYIANDILELAHIASRIAGIGHSRLLYLSSSEVYGRDGQHDEQADQLVPARQGSRMEYALGKLTAEHVLLNLADSGTHSLRIVRPFNVVGQWQSDALGFVMPAFFKAALNNKPLLVHGDGQQTRSFCDVNDLVDGILSVQQQGLEGAVYNIGNPDNRVTILALARQIIALSGSSSLVQLIDPQTRYGSRYLEAFNKIPAIDRVRQHTGWQPDKDLQAVLQGLLAFYTNQSGDASPATSPTRSPATAPVTSPDTRIGDTGPTVTTPASQAASVINGTTVIEEAETHTHVS